MFELFDTDKDHALNLNELAALLEDIGSKITALPAVCVFSYNLDDVFLMNLVDCASGRPTRQVSGEEAPETC